MQDETQTPGGDAAAQEPNDAPEPGASTDQGGSPFLGVDETGPPTEDVEIEMPPDYVGTPPPDLAEQAGAGAAGDVEIEMPPDPVGQVGADAGGVGEAGGPGETVEDVGEAGGPSETIEAAENRITKIDPDTGEETVVEIDPVTGEEIGTIKIDPDTGEEVLEITMEPIETRVDEHGDVWVRQEHYDEAWDIIGQYQDEDMAEQTVEAYADAVEDVGESVVDFVEGIPIVGDDVGDALGDAYDVVEDVVDHEDDPVPEDVDPWG